GQHVLDERLVARDVHDARLHGVGEWQGREPQVDRDAAPLLLLPAVGVDPGQRLDERCLAVVDVPGRADYEAADGAGGGAGAGVARGGGRGVCHAWRSQKSRAGRVLASPKWWRTKRARRRRCAAACGGASAGSGASGSFRATRSRWACAGRRVTWLGRGGSHRTHSTPPSAVLKATCLPPERGGTGVPSRTQDPSAGAKPSAPSRSHKPRSATASTASGAANRSASSPVVRVP